MSKLLKAAAEELDADVSDLDVRNREIFVKRAPKRRISYASLTGSLIKRGLEPITGKGHFRAVKDVPHHPSLATTAGRWSENYTSDAHVAEVEVDIETGLVGVVRVTTALDCGFPINPQLVEGQVDGQVSMAQGHALSEEVLLQGGCVTNPSFLEYKIPCALDMVETKQIHVTTERYIKGQPYDSKEVGEGHLAGCLAAIANAVYDATGVRVNELPIYPQKIIEAIKPPFDST
jgi:nicotinate dehydrogenase medium molybdopterin subunit